MDKNSLIQLTNEIYRLTLLFPKKEPLRYKMREIADDLIISLSQGLSSGKLNESGKPNEQQRMLADLEILDGFFEVAKAQNWVAPLDLLRVQEEYNRIKAEIKKINKQPPTQETALMKETTLTKETNKVQPSQSQANKPPARQFINERQKKILEILKEKGQLQVWQVKQVFPEVSKRTLRRDFESLLKQGIIERRGERNDTFYKFPTSYELGR